MNALVKQKIIWIILLAGIVLVILGYQRGWHSKVSPVIDDSTPQSELTKQVISETEPPQIVSTKPDPLEEAIVSATEEIEIAFNRSIENAGEFKLRIEPETEFKVELSGDRKTAKIIPVKPYALGSTYTIFIGPATKFDGVGDWGQEKIFHIRTIRYRGV